MGGGRAPPVAEPQEWREITRWKGSGVKNTDDFAVTGEKWRIRWAAKDTATFGGVFQAYVHQGDRLVSVAANQQGTGEGDSVLRGAGAYYLQINSANANWIVVVEEWR